MDQPPADPNMSGQVVGEEIFGEPGEIPDPSVAKDPEPKQVLDLSTTQDVEGAQVSDLAITKDSKPEQTLDPTTTMVLELEQISDPMVTKESIEFATLPVITGTSCLISSFFLQLM